MRDWASELRAIADGRLMLNVRNGVTVSRSMLAMIADELDAERAAHAETKQERDDALEALDLISHMHDSNPPLPLADMPELDYARRTISNMRHEARAAARRVREGGKVE